MDSPVLDATFASFTDQISCSTRTFWMQQGFSGGFIDDLEGDDRVILTAADYNSNSWRADNDTLHGSPYPENETYQGVPYHHGEFNFHTMNSVRGEALWGISYGDPPVVDADSNNDLLVSMEEAFELADWWNSSPSVFQYSDLGQNGGSTFLGWDDYTPPDTPTGLTVYPVVDGDSGLGLNWDANTQADLVGYKVFRDRAYILSTPVENYTDYAVSLDTAYTYWVSAFDIAANESELSDSATYCPAACGDVNKDGKVTSADATYIINYVYRGGPPPACPPEPYLCCGDVNLDGRITGADANYIIAYIYRGGPPPCEPDGRSSSEEYAKVGLSILRISQEVTELAVLAQFDVPIAFVHIEIIYDPETVEMLDPFLTPRTQGLELFYDLSLKPGYLILGMLDLKGENHIEPGKGSILTLRIQGKHGKPDPNSLCLQEAIFVDLDSKTLHTEILNGCKPSGGAQSASVSAGSPISFALTQNFPNPFSSATTLKYAIPTPSCINLKIYDISGKEIRTLVDENRAAGFHSTRWDGRDDFGREVSTGIYLCRLRAGEFTGVKKMILLR